MHIEKYAYDIQAKPPQRYKHTWIHTIYSEQFANPQFLPSSPNNKLASSSIKNTIQFQFKKKKKKKNLGSLLTDVFVYS